MTGRFLFICGALLVLANVALGDGTYQRTRDGRTLVWNNDPKPGDEATWSGDRDREGYAHGFGTLIWYTKESDPSAAKPAVYARYWGNMVAGKLEGPVNVHSKRKTGYAIFADGARVTRWATGRAPLRAGAQWRATVARQSMTQESEAPAEGPISAEATETERPTPESAITESSRTLAFNPSTQDSSVTNSESIGEEAPEPSTNVGPAWTTIDIDDFLRLLVWPPPYLDMRSMSKGGLTLAKARLTKEEVIGLADAAARLRGYDPTEYQRPEPQYDLSDRAWSLLYEEKPADGADRVGAKHLGVAVDDKTKRTALVPGK